MTIPDPVALPLPTISRQHSSCLDGLTKPVRERPYQVVITIIITAAVIALIVGGASPTIVLSGAALAAAAAYGTKKMFSAYLKIDYRNRRGTKWGLCTGVTRREQ